MLFDQVATANATTFHLDARDCFVFFFCLIKTTPSTQHLHRDVLHFHLLLELQVLLRVRVHVLGVLHPVHRHSMRDGRQHVPAAQQRRLPVAVDSIRFGYTRARTLAPTHAQKNEHTSKRANEHTTRAHEHKSARAHARTHTSGGSTCIYVFLYSVYYFFAKTQMSGTMQTTFYFGSVSARTHLILKLHTLVPSHPLLSSSLPVSHSPFQVHVPYVPGAILYGRGDRLPRQQCVREADLHKHQERLTES